MSAIRNLPVRAELSWPEKSKCLKFKHQKKSNKMSAKKTAQKWLRDFIDDSCAGGSFEEAAWLSKALEWLRSQPDVELSKEEVEELVNPDRFKDYT